VLVEIPRPVAIACLTLFGALLILFPLLAGVTGWRGMQLFDIFYRAGALVFGGGHVVLPLLRAGLVPAGWIGDDRFLAGYGTAQALPGPLFAIAAYLGAVAGGGVAGAAAALIGIFAPGLLIVTGALPFWSALRANAASRSIVAGANAAVVGILAAALYDPLWTTAVSSWADVALIALGLSALLRWRTPSVAVVALMIAGALAIAALR
jgi:chromate transporter